MSDNYPLTVRVTSWLADWVESLSSRDSLVMRLSWWAYERERRRREALARSLGWRIVAHVETGLPDDDDMSAQVYDAETRELLADVSDPRELDAAWRDEWLHEDRVMDADWPTLLKAGESA